MSRYERRASAGPIAHGLVGLAHVERAAVGLGVDGHGRDAHRAAGAGHAHGDLAAVRDQDLPEGRRAHAAQPGLRFSRKARIPSWPSGETRMSAMRSTV